MRNVKRNARVILSIGRERFEGEARFLEDHAERDRAMAMVRRKYWVFRPMIAFGEFLAALGIVKNVTGAFEVTLIASRKPVFTRFRGALLAVMGFSFSYGENHSHFITSIGSVRPALRAGSKPADQTTAPITNALAISIGGS